MMEQTGTIKAVCVGLPKTYDSPEGAWKSAIFKSEVAGPVRLTKKGLVGDGQATKILHGGPDKALLAYPWGHYDYWREAGLLDGQPGGFGENLTVENLDEKTVCIGDVFQAGSVLLQVSQPRDPCWKLARKWKRPDLVAHCMQTGRSGWYFRVLKPGNLESGQNLRRIEQPHPTWTVERAMEVKQRVRQRFGEAMELAALPPLATIWRVGIFKRLGLP